jgi:uncharacterized protein
MLITFKVENFRSITNDISLNMIPAKGISKPYNLIKIEKNPNIKKLLKSIVIFGSNGSGKTNTIRALFTMKSIIAYSKFMNSGDTFHDYDPFLLNDSYSNKPTSFSIDFIQKNVQYRYSFAYDLEKIVSEELSYYHGKKEIFIFKRTFNSLEPYIDHEELAHLFQSTGNNVLFLSKANNEYKKFGPVFEWFNNHLNIIGPTSKLDDKLTIRFMNGSPENKQRIINFMNFADFDILGVTGENKQIEDPEIINKLQKIIMVLNENNNNSDTNRKLNLVASDIKSIRKKIDGTEIIQDFSKFESDGTKQFFKMSGLWLDALLNKSQTLVFDEFDIRLHPDLQNYLIQVFHDPEINKTNSQLIFTTHNTRILNKGFFRREQINFVEKNPETKSTTLNSLYDYEQRQDKSIEKGYYLGRYGGLPDIKYGIIK